MDTSHLKISRAVIAKNSMLNLIGQIFPFLAALFSIPVIIHAIGTERVGILTLMWSLIGYLSFFDLGLGRALTHELSKKLSTKGTPQELSATVWTSLFFLLMIGSISLLLGLTSAKWVTYAVLKISPDLQHETLISLYLLTTSLPIVIVSTGIIGILQAHQRFDLINSVQIPLGVSNFIGPLLITFFSNSLIPIVWVLIVARLIAFVYLCLFALKVMPFLKKFKMIKLDVMKSMFSYGGWMTITNIVSPLLTYFDRFILGALVSVTTVAYYTTPYEIITKLWVIPVSLVRVLFPEFSKIYNHDRAHTIKLFVNGVKYIFIILFPVILLIITFAFEGLNLWLGYEFASNGFRVLQWLSLGIFINSIAHIFINHIQGVGRPDLSAKLHLCELPVYLIVVFQLIKHFGIEGAAIAWCLRVSIDAFILFVMSIRLLSMEKTTILKMSGIFILAAMTLYYPFTLNILKVKICFLGITWLIYGVMTWIFLISKDDRIWIKKLMGRKEIKS